jgi:gamma-glutamyltranspeptidase
VLLEDGIAEVICWKAAFCSRLSPLRTPPCPLATHHSCQDVAQKLRLMGHSLQQLSDYDRARFGRGQIIRRVSRAASDGRTREVYMAGSDPRADGCALGY